MSNNQNQKSSLNNRQDRFSQLMFGTFPAQRDGQQKSQDPSPKEDQQIDFIQIMQQLDSIMTSIDQLKPMVKQLSPYLKFLKKP